MFCTQQEEGQKKRGESQGAKLEDSWKRGGGTRARREARRGTADPATRDSEDAATTPPARAPTGSSLGSTATKRSMARARARGRTRDSMRPSQSGAMGGRESRMCVCAHAARRATRARHPDRRHQVGIEREGPCTHVFVLGTAQRLQVVMIRKTTHTNASRLTRRGESRGKGYELKFYLLGPAGSALLT